MDLDLAGRTAVVTGASRGIGLAVTRALAAEGVRVVAGARNITPELRDLPNVLSGKRVGKRVPPDMVLLVFVLVVAFTALLIAYPWWVLTIGTVCYLACLPLGWVSYKEYQRKDAVSATQGPTAADAPASDVLPTPPAEDPDRPARLN